MPETLDTGVQWYNGALTRIGRVEGKSLRACRRMEEWRSNCCTSSTLPQRVEALCVRVFTLQTRWIERLKN